MAGRLRRRLRDPDAAQGGPAEARAVCRVLPHLRSGVGSAHASRCRKLQPYRSQGGMAAAAAERTRSLLCRSPQLGWVSPMRDSARTWCAVRSPSQGASVRSVAAREIGDRVVLTSAAHGAFTVYHKLVTGLAILGWTSTVMTACFFGALNALGIAILGEYVLRIY